MAATVARLKTLHAKLGNVGVDKLMHAARKEGLAGVNRDTVKDYLSTDSSAQLLRPLPESKGRTGSEAQGFRVQMDLIDFKGNQATWQGAEWSVILVVIDVMSRRVWAAPAKTKAPDHVEPVLRRLLGKMASDLPNKVQIISTDQANEWKGAVDALLKSKNIVRRTKDPSDTNALSVLDRAIQTLKRRLAQSLTDKKGAWPGRVAEVVEQYNSTVHPATRDEPEEFNAPGHEVKRFLAEQDNAEALAHNQKLLEKRTQRLETEGAYRVPKGGAKAFRRGYLQAYSSDVKQARDVSGSVVTDTSGAKIDIKRIMPVNEHSGYAEEGLRDPKRERKKAKLTALMDALYAWLAPGERVTMSQATAWLKGHLGADVLKVAGVQRLAQAVELFDTKFTITPGGRYIMRKAEATRRPAFPGARRLVRAAPGGS